MLLKYPQTLPLSDAHKFTKKQDKTETLRSHAELRVGRLVGVGQDRRRLPLHMPTMAMT